MRVGIQLHIDRYRYRTSPFFFYPYMKIKLTYRIKSLSQSCNTMKEGIKKAREKGGEGRGRRINAT